MTETQPTTHEPVKSERQYQVSSIVRERRSSISSSGFLRWSFPLKQSSNATCATSRA